MKSREQKVLEKLNLPHGMEIDLDEGWRKLISRQFGGDAARGFGELIQNFIDSYPTSCPWDNRTGEIETYEYSISITDYGEGMDRDRLKLLVTLGGTDKNEDPDKIGTFGIGFFSIFNPALGTQRVTVTTKCEGEVVRLIFTVKDPEKIPGVSINVLDEKIKYSTRIEVEFNNDVSPKKCLKQANRSLEYYPCRVKVNGERFPSIWEKARKEGAHFFKDGHCTGFTEPGDSTFARILCKYEHIMTTSIRNLVKNKYSLNDIRNYYQAQVPYLPGISSTINCNNLKVTISRDSFYMNGAYREMMRVLGQALLPRLFKMINEEEPELVAANHYILRDLIQVFLVEKSGKKINKLLGDHLKVIEKLTEAKIYRINERKGKFSLKDIHEMHDHSLPLFFSPRQTNMRWLGGSFKHDFIVLPPYCEPGKETPEFYDSLFECLFGNVVNLDTIRSSPKRIKELVAAGIVDKKALSPKYEILAEKKLDPEETELAEELNRLLEDKQIRGVIEKELHVELDRIKTIFFTVEEEGATIATGIFDDGGRALSEAGLCNFAKARDAREQKGDPRYMLIGMRRDHPMIRRLIQSEDPLRSYFALTFIAHELAHCQQLLVPHSPFYHLVKERLAAGMRKALMKKVLAAA